MELVGKTLIKRSRKLSLLLGLTLALCACEKQNEEQTDEALSAADVVSESSLQTAGCRFEDVEIKIRSHVTRKVMQLVCTDATSSTQVQSQKNAVENYIETATSEARDLDTDPQIAAELESRIFVAQATSVYLDLAIINYQLNASSPSFLVIRSEIDNEEDRLVDRFNCGVTTQYVACSITGSERIEMISESAEELLRLYDYLLRFFPNAEDDDKAKWLNKKNSIIAMLILIAGRQ